MSIADGREPGAAPEHPPPPPAGAPAGEGGEPSPSTLAALAGLFAALRQLFIALRKLATAEAKVVRAGIPLFFIAATALVAFAVSLWVCLVALIGWALMYATHSLGLALGLLVVIHAILIVGVWSMIKYALRQATFPQARAELRMLGRTVLHDLGRIAGTREAVRGAPPDAAAGRKENP
ncbi:MAG TPA: hypothetical protein VFK29_02495 [Rhodanobacteraceae bacterium]|nr:hypothetical protein [Rhodanobacteraceae bacterium]